jgi:hypothetical protein
MTTLVDRIDYDTKRIYLSAVTQNSTIDTLDIYREIRKMRRLNDSHRAFKPIIIAGGNITKITNTTATPAYVQLLDGCRFVPFDSTHKLKIIRDTFTDDGVAGRDCFDRSSLSISSQVDIDIDFPEIEIRQVITDLSSIMGLLSNLTDRNIGAAVWSFLQENNKTAGANLQLAKTAAENSFAVSA